MSLTSKQVQLQRALEKQMPTFVAVRFHRILSDAIGSLHGSIRLQSCHAARNGHLRMQSQEKSYAHGTVEVTFLVTDKPPWRVVA